jgi:sulfoxide reductase heme-binding subunit YedZ
VLGTAFDFGVGIRPGWQVLGAGLAVVVLDLVTGRWKARPRARAVAAE